MPPHPEWPEQAPLGVITVPLYLDPQGHWCAPAGAVPPPPAQVIAMHRHMVRVRLFDTQAVALQRTGQLGTYPSAWGLEGSSVALGMAMQAEDVLCPYYRDLGAYAVRGIPLEAILQYWGGDERGSDFAGSRADLPICVPIASQCLHAVGVAWAFQYRQQPRVAVATVGDGGTSKGDFYAALNAAGVWKLPLVVVIHNNQWAISVPVTAQTAAPTLAHKAVAAGIPGYRVDGWDPLAVYAVMRMALDHARSGQGPVLVEAVTYRVPDHTTADDASRYRDPQVAQTYRDWDPLVRLEAWMHAQAIQSPDQTQAVYIQVAAEIEAVIQAYHHLPDPPRSGMFDYLYAQLPDYWWEQYAEVVHIQEDSGYAPR